MKNRGRIKAAELSPKTGNTIHDGMRLSEAGGGDSVKGSTPRYVRHPPNLSGRRMRRQVLRTAAK